MNRYIFPSDVVPGDLYKSWDNQIVIILSIKMIALDLVRINFLQKNVIDHEYHDAANKLNIL